MPAIGRALMSQPVCWKAVARTRKAHLGSNAREGFHGRRNRAPSSAPCAILRVLIECGSRIAFEDLAEDPSPVRCDLGLHRFTQIFAAPQRFVENLLLISGERDRLTPVLRPIERRRAPSPCRACHVH